MPPQTMAKLIAGAVIIFALLLGFSQSTFVVEPGYRGVRVTLGNVSPVFLPEGFGLKLPFISRVENLLIRQQTVSMEAVCYSSDLQKVQTQLRVLYRVPEESVVSIYQDYYGDPFSSLLAPRIHEAIKEVAAMRSAELIVQQRDLVKARTLDAARQKVGTLLHLEDIVIEDIVLSPELEAAIELKMVQEQEANKARFTQQKVEIEAKTAVIKARGEAESIQIRGDALRQNPAYIELEVVDKWSGKTPLVIGGDARSAGMLLPLRELEKTEVSVDSSNSDQE